MPLLIGIDHTHLDPHVAQAFDELLASVQTWAGKQEADGKWVDVVKDGAGLSGYLRVDGTGNSWVVGPASSHAGTSIAYTLVGDTLIYSFYILNTALTIASATNQIYLRLPDGFSCTARYHRGMGSVINGAVSQAATLLAGSLTQYVIIQKDTAGNFSDDSGGSFSAFGTIEMQITRS